MIKMTGVCIRVTLPYRNAGILSFTQTMSLNRNVLTFYLIAITTMPYIASIVTILPNIGTIVQLLPFIASIVKLLPHIENGYS